MGTIPCGLVSEFTRQLLPAQSGIWFAQELEPESSIFRSAECIEIYGAIVPALFETALQQALDETDALHLRFCEDDDGRIWQTIGPPPSSQLAFVDVSGQPDPRTAVQSWIRADLAERINLSKGQLFSYALFSATPYHFYWYQGYHHILIDGVGCGLFAQRVASIYTAALDGRPCPAPDYSSVRKLWDFDSSYRASGQFDRDREFWLGRFGDRPLPAISLANGGSLPDAGFMRRTVRLPPLVAERLKTVARQNGTSAPRTLLAATAAYLHRMTEATDIVLGLPVTGRPDATTMSTPGLMVNVLPLRVEVCRKTTVGELIAQTSQTVREMMRHQCYRGEDLRRDLRLPAAHPRLFGPVINIMLFNYRLQFGASRGIASNVSLRHVEDIMISVYERPDGEGIRIDFEANRARYDENNLAAHHERFVSFLATFMDVGADYLVAQLPA